MHVGNLKNLKKQKKAKKMNFFIGYEFCFIKKELIDCK
jgi:hypothetical protein